MADPIPAQAPTQAPTQAPALAPASAAAGLLPVTHGSCTLAEAPHARMTSLMPFAGQTGALDAALQAGFGLGFPPPNRLTRAGTATCLWMGRGQALLIGPDAPPQDATALARYAALTDQSDAWVTLDLSGGAVLQVLARLVPIDLRAPAFGLHSTARTQLQHANVSLHRIGDGFRIMGFRSMARTLVHEIADAMAGVAARGAVP